MIKKIIICIIAVAVCFFLGFYTNNYLFQNKSSTSTENRLNGDYQFINPLLECDINAISRNTNLDQLRIKLEQQFGSNTSIYYRDMNNGPWFGIHEREYFSPASLIKVSLMMSYLKKAESDPTILNKEILNTTIYDPTSQNIQPKITLAPNQKYTIKQLIEQMIIYSDDVSFNLLNKGLTAKEVTSVYNDLGVDISKAIDDPNGNIITVKAFASFFRILFNASYLNPQMSEYALKILSQSQFKEGIVANLPQNITVAHKFGERQYLDTGLKQLHDCGIVYLPQKPYLLCIMTRGNNFDTLKSTIGEISKVVYSYISSLNN